MTDREDVTSMSLGPESRRVVPWNIASSWSVGDPPEGLDFVILECCLFVFVFLFVPLPVLLLLLPFPFPGWEEGIFFNVSGVLYLGVNVTEDAAELPSQSPLNIPAWTGLTVPRFACLGWRTRRRAPGCDITQKSVCEGFVYRYWPPVDIVWFGGAVFALYARPAWVFRNRLISLFEGWAYLLLSVGGRDGDCGVVWVGWLPSGGGGLGV